MATRYFKGFSTIASQKTRERTYYDLDLIKFDLMNHFQTRVGERVMRPTWGCRIWDWLMDPLTPDLRDTIVSEVLSICHADSRLKVQDVTVSEYEHGLRIEILLEYRPFDVIETFAVDFARREDARWQNEFI